MMRAASRIRGQQSSLPYAAAVMALGAGSQLSQVVLVREWLMVFHGNELSIGLALAAWLFWGALGSFAAGRLAGRIRNPLHAAVGIAAGLWILLPATILALRSIRWFFNVVPGEMLSFADVVRAGLPLMAPACLLWGAQFVFLARLWRDRPAARGLQGAIHTYTFEAVGNLLGGMAFSLLLVHVLDPLACGLLAAALLLCALALLAPPRTRLRRLLGFLLLLSAAGAPLLATLETWSYQAHWRRAAPERPLVAVHASRYGRIAVARYGRQYAFYQSGQLMFSTGTAAGPEYGLEEQESAILAHLSLAQHPAPRAVLLIGGGLRGVLRELAAHPLETLDYVEVDPALVRAALPHVPAGTRAALADPRVRVLTTDGRMLVKTSDRTYDMILADVPDPATAVLNRFYTREFFEEARRRLRPGGVLVISATSTAGLRDPTAAHRNATLYHTLKTVFARVLPVGDRTLLFFATDAQDDYLTADPQVLRARHRATGIDSPGFSDRLFVTLLQEIPLRRIYWILRHHGRRRADAFQPPDSGPLLPPSVAQQEQQERETPAAGAALFINSDFRPIGYYYTLLFRNRQTRQGADALLEGLLRVRIRWLAAAVAALLLVSVGLRLIARRRHAASGARWALATAVGSTGLTTMATQVALLFAFQSQYGFVYEMLGLIMAVFMGGLAVGAALCPARRSWRRLACLQLTIAGWSSVMAFALPAAAGLTSPALILGLFAAMTFLAGLWNGMNFPLALACAATPEVPVDRSVGTIYGLELIGACLGALLAGGLIIPVLGFVACCLFAAALNVAACCAIVLR